MGKLLAALKSSFETEVVRTRVSGRECAWVVLAKGEGMVARVGGRCEGLEQVGGGGVWNVGGGLRSMVELDMHMIRVMRARVQGWKP